MSCSPHSRQQAKTLLCPVGCYLLLAGLGSPLDSSCHSRTYSSQAALGAYRAAACRTYQTVLQVQPDPAPLPKLPDTAASGKSKQCQAVLTMLTACRAATQSAVLMASRSTRQSQTLSCCPSASPATSPLCGRVTTVQKALSVVGLAGSDKPETAEGVPWDPLRDGPLRYCGYANECG